MPLLDAKKLKKLYPYGTPRKDPRCSITLEVISLIDGLVETRRSGGGRSAAFGLGAELLHAIVTGENRYEIAEKLFSIAPDKGEMVDNLFAIATNVNLLRLTRPEKQHE